MKYKLRVCQFMFFKNFMQAGETEQCSCSYLLSLKQNNLKLYCYKPMMI